MIWLFKRVIKAIVVIALGGAFAAESCQAQSFQFPPYGAQRGRMVARDGIGHSVRYRWGNGLTPTGGAVLTSAIDAFAPAVIAVAGRDYDSTSASRAADAARTASQNNLAAAQQRANDLLVRTARLVDPTFTAGGSPPSGSGSTNTEATTPTTPPFEITGDDPWGNVPDNPAPAGN